VTFAFTAHERWGLRGPDEASVDHEAGGGEVGGVVRCDVVVRGPHGGGVERVGHGGGILPGDH
jgi:hypothetical protein